MELRGLCLFLPFQHAVAHHVDLVHLMQNALASDKTLPLPTPNRWNPAGDQNFLCVMVGFGCKMSDVTVE